MLTRGLVLDIKKVLEVLGGRRISLGINIFLGIATAGCSFSARPKRLLNLGIDGVDDISTLLSHRLHLRLRDGAENVRHKRDHQDAENGDYHEKLNERKTLF